MGKPLEDPEKVKRWGLISARPSEFLVRMRRGKVSLSGQGASCFKWPWDSVAIVPTSVQRLQFCADQVTSEKVGVQVKGLAVYRIAEPLIAYRMLNFSFPERASEKLQRLLEEMFIGAARRLVANLTVEECLSRRKEGIAAELMREIAPVVSGEGRAGDTTNQGWGVVLDTIEIQDVRVLSGSVFAHLQAPYRQEQERLAREAELTKQRSIQQTETAAERELQLARVAAQREIEEQRREAEREAALRKLAAQREATEAALASERSLARARLDAELEHARMEADAQALRHAAQMAEAAQQAERAHAQAEVAIARQRQAEAELAVAQLEASRLECTHAVDLARRRAEREIATHYSPESIQLVMAQQLPQLAAALQQKMGTVNITAMEGANPFAYLASAVDTVVGMARAAGVKLPGLPTDASKS
jgi:regulator of protease activity HflC (stomatin/prohibitin superfamily)